MYYNRFLMLSISEFELCQNKNGSYAENIQCCLLIKINNETMLQNVHEDYFIFIFNHHNVFTFQSKNNLFVNSKLCRKKIFIPIQ